MSCLRAPWQNGPYKNKHKGRHKNSYSIMTQQTFRKHIFLCFSDFSFFIFFFIDNFIKEFSKKCWVTALVRSMTFIGGLNQFNAIANLTLSQHFFGEEKEKKMHLISPTMPLRRWTRRSPGTVILIIIILFVCCRRCGAV